MLDLLNQPEFVIFTTREYATASESSVASASKRLERIAATGFLTRIVRGLWANTRHPFFHPLSCVPYLLGAEQGYVSFLTALHLHDVISQIPATIQVATTGHARELRTPAGTFEFLQVKPALMQQGVEWSETRLPYLIATAEKALLDVLYQSTRKKRRFARLPELELAESGFRVDEFNRLLTELPYPVQIRSAIESRTKSFPP